MTHLSSLYKQSFGLLTDLYQLTMAYGYWKTGHGAHDAVFHLHFRRNPFDGGYTVAAGLATAVEYLTGLRFTPDDVAFLATLRGNDDRPLFETAFLEVLRGIRFNCDLDAVPEGTVVFPHEPLLRIRGPLVIAQLVESVLLNIINFQTLVTTKAARIVMAAKGEPVLEFGLRRAQGFDEALSASRAAYLGGCAATSNVMAGSLFGIPVRGTHAHSWVMCFDDECEAFRAYAGAMPNNCVFLVDTYDTIAGVKHAAAIGRELKAAGHDMIGIRLDSGDLAWLSIEARKILDEAGLPNAMIMASNDLDEHIIASLKDQGAKIAVWGVGTRLVTGHDDAALGGVYKLSALRAASGAWQDKVKISDQTAKVSTPGMLQVRRYYGGREPIGDVIYDERWPLENSPILVDPLDMTRRKSIPNDARGEDLLAPVLRAGELVGELPSLEQSRRHASEQLGLFHQGIKRLMHPHQYPVGLESGLHDRKTALILKERGIETAESIPTRKD